MQTVVQVKQVFDAIQGVKTGATAFSTNFFPVEKKLQAWIDHGELVSETTADVAFFLRKDRDLWHFYYCAGNPAVLGKRLAELPFLKSDRVVVDLVGNETTLADVLGALEGTGFRRYSRLQRMARSFQVPIPASSEENVEIVNALPGDEKAILELLEASFDHYADQLPVLHEIESAIAAGQMLTVKCDGAVAALLYFETQGFTSTIRYWVVAEAFRSRRFGGALMRHYLEAQSAVKRFILWVVADNENAVRKYQHYGYAADGLIDHVLANQMIRS